MDVSKVIRRIVNSRVIVVGDSTVSSIWEERENVVNEELVSYSGGTEGVEVECVEMQRCFNSDGSQSGKSSSKRVTSDKKGS